LRLGEPFFVISNIYNPSYNGKVGWDEGYYGQLFLVIISKKNPDNGIVYKKNWRKQEEL